MRHASLTVNKADGHITVDGFTGPYDGDRHGATGRHGVNGENFAYSQGGNPVTNPPTPAPTMQWPPSTTPTINNTRAS